MLFIAIREISWTNISTEIRLLASETRGRIHVILHVVSIFGFLFFSLDRSSYNNNFVLSSRAASALLFSETGEIRRLGPTGGAGSESDRIKRLVKLISS